MLLSVFVHVFLLKVVLSKVLNPDIKMKGKSAAVIVHKSFSHCACLIRSNKHSMQ